MDELPYSQACENNKKPIAGELARLLAQTGTVLEIGAGTGQHAVFFAASMPWLQWRPTELAANLPILRPRCDAYAGSNLRAPMALDVCARPWPSACRGDALFTANTFHIMAWSAVESLFAALAEHGDSFGKLAVYGPFNYDGRYTSASNAEFDQWLSQRDSRSAIRDFEAVDRLASSSGYELLADIGMPANNRLLVWSRVTPT